MFIKDSLNDVIADVVENGRVLTGNPEEAKESFITEVQFEASERGLVFPLQEIERLAEAFAATVE